MITREEIDSVSAEQEVSPADVERDYMYGWLLAGLFGESKYASTLVLKGGNALRKGYFPATRFSGDLDFSTPEALDSDDLLNELNRTCQLVQARTDVRFETSKNRLMKVQQIRHDKTEYKFKLYFHDFYGASGDMVISVRVGATEFDRLYLAPQHRNLIHPYSDVKECSANICVVKLEEALADKLKCLLQRRSSFDLYDLIHATFIGRDIEVDRGELMRTFLRKTIFQPSPHAAKDLLLGVPFDRMREFWDRKISCPAASRMPFHQALANFQDLINDLFAGFANSPGAALMFFGADARNLIMEAGQKQHLMKITYHGVPRLIEPYSLSFKRRKDGVGQEYFYAWDRTGGHSGPGIKTFLHYDIENLELTDEKFEPQFEVEVSKAGELHGDTYFGRYPRRQVTPRRRASRKSAAYSLYCPYCGRTFMRQSRSNVVLRQHKDKFGNRCPGRRGRFV